MKRKVEVIAEAGVNHNGSLAMAKELIEAAVDSGASVVKFQTFKSEKVISRFARKAEYQITNTGTSESQLEMVKKLELSPSDHIVLIEHCQKRKIQFLSTPFDLDSVDLLTEELKVDRLKIPSGEITNALLLLKMARSQLPLIMSTGMSTIGEVEAALGALAFGMLNPRGGPKNARDFTDAFSSDAGQLALKERVTLLHCTTEYPAPFGDTNLRAMQTLALAFGLPVGFSDHTPGINAPIAAVALGAVLIEKHFTLDKNLPGPDHKASLTPTELKDMITGIREVEAMLGNGLKLPAPSERKNIVVARRSIVASRRIQKGEILSEENLDVKRPGTGISPFDFWFVIGRTADRDYEVDEEIRR